MAASSALGMPPISASDRKSGGEGKRVDVGGGRIIKKKKNKIRRLTVGRVLLVHVMTAASKVVRNVVFMEALLEPCDIQTMGASCLNPILTRHDRRFL